MEIKGLYFENCGTCCPEQYDVWDENENLVGYVRLRFGHLTCEYPEVGGEEIYHTRVGDEWCGELESEAQRKVYLSEIADKIFEKIGL